MKPSERIEEIRMARLQECSTSGFMAEAQEHAKYYAIKTYLDEQYEKAQNVKEPQWTENWKCSKHGEAWSSSDKYPKGCCECHEAFFANKMKTEMIKAWKDAKG